MKSILGHPVYKKNYIRSTPCIHEEYTGTPCIHEEYTGTPCIHEQPVYIEPKLRHPVQCRSKEYTV